MALMLSETYKALLEAGTSEEQASKAATELAGYEARFSAIASTQRLHSWMLAYVITVLTAVALKLFS